MNIRSKVTVLIAALFVVLGVAELFVAKTVLVPSFAELEHADAGIAMRRVKYALDSTLDQLALSAGGWGNWTDAYRFMQDHNRTFVNEQITIEGLKQLNINALMFFDLTGQFVASISHDFNSEPPFTLDIMQGKALPENFPWRDNLGKGGTARGILRTNRGLLLIAAAPVLDGFGRGPIRGMVMMGRLLTVAEISRIGAQAQVDLSMVEAPSGRTSDRLVENATVTQIYRSFDDIYGRPVLSLRVDVPRRITQRGGVAVNYASAYLAAAAVIILILLVLILNRVVLNPLARVTRHAVAIGEGKDLTTRLDFKANDEIGVLAREFDRMVARLAESRSKLIDQSFQAGFAELAKGVLHNLGNAMTPIGVRLTSLRYRLQLVPADDAESAVAELARNDVDPTRRANLEEFVRLACVELASFVKSVADDIEIMSRQASIVQAALSEQMGATRNEHVLESVRLPELLAQALEVVPDAALQVLDIEADESLVRVGAVTVARSVLRLVLQNVIINAADAIRESGRPLGRLYIAAEIVRGSNGEQLHLCCTDSGVGIDRDNLARIFERGFSTKSTKTNSGIGLHWCANSIGALGGRIWAASKGAGLGASMHVMVPLAPAESVLTARVA
jgi:two-component system NtrC family sensor kinase